MVSAGPTATAASSQSVVAAVAIPQIEPGSRDRLPCTAPSQNLNFSSYWAGQTFDGLEVSAVIRVCTESGGTNYVSYIYGDCTPRGGGCAPPIDVQTWPVEARNRSMYATGPEEFRLMPADTTVEGAPAARFEGGHRLEIYHPDTTVVVFGDDRGRVDRFARALLEGQSVLTELASYGLDFDDACVDDIHGCQTGDPEGLVLWVGLLWVAPFLGALFLGRLWLLLVPVVVWPINFLGLYMGWWGSGVGELWQLALIMDALLGVAVVALGLALRWLFVRVFPSRHLNQPTSA